MVLRIGLITKIASEGDHDYARVVCGQYGSRAVGAAVVHEHELQFQTSPGARASTSARYKTGSARSSLKQGTITEIIVSGSASRAGTP